VEAPAGGTASPQTVARAEDLPSQCGVERMNHHYESRLWELLEKQKLADLSQFHQPGCFDEVPLCSRQSDIEFLPTGERAANEILLRFALKFLNAVIAYEEHRSGYFAAITVWDFSADRLIPHLFFWSKSVRGLKQELKLRPATSRFAKQISRLVGQIDLGERLAIGEDTSTVHGATRIFIAPEHPPYKGFPTLDTFCKQGRAARSR
jgi:hypothetical protein